LNKSRVLTDLPLDIQSMSDLCHFKADQWVLLVTTSVILCKNFDSLRLLNKQQ
jgi:hypothetical protein